MFIIHGFQVIAKSITDAVSAYLNKYPGRKGDILEVKEGKKVHYVRTNYKGESYEIKKGRK